MGMAHKLSASLMIGRPCNDETADNLSSSDSFLNPLKSSDLIAAAVFDFNPYEFAVAKKD